MTQALNLDADSNLWVTGDHTVTKLFTDPYAIIDGVTITANPSTPPLILSTSAKSPIDIHMDSTLYVSDGNSVDNCSYSYSNTKAGAAFDSWNTGVVISRDAQNTLYIGNTGAIAKVPLPPSSASPSRLPECTLLNSSQHMHALAIKVLNNIWSAGSHKRSNLIHCAFTHL